MREQPLVRRAEKRRRIGPIRSPRRFERIFPRRFAVRRAHLWLLVGTWLALWAGQGRDDEPDFPSLPGQTSSEAVVQPKRSPNRLRSRTRGPANRPRQRPPRQLLPDRKSVV